jgi:glycolate oxidase FAD binding subunit
VGRAIGDARREISAGSGSVVELGSEVDDARELPGRATEGALVRAALPLAASGAFAATAARFSTFAEIVADVASGIVRVHLTGDDDGIVSDAGALLVGAGVVGGNGRVERRSAALRERLATWPSRPKGDFLMRRIKDEFDPNAILEPGRTAFA